MLTSKCNMSCKHCCQSCTMSGSHMPLKTFKKAIQFANDYNDYIALGGGEPTLHPNFEEVLGYAILHTTNDEEYKPFIVTNGSITKYALLIANLTKQNIIHGELSQDVFHDPIDSKVIDAFTKINRIRNTTKYHGPAPVGRALKYLGINKQRFCACTNMFIRPSGKIYQCGCRRSTCIGHVDTGLTKEYHPDECYMENRTTW